MVFRMDEGWAETCCWRYFRNGYCSVIPATYLLLLHSIQYHLVTCLLPSLSTTQNAPRYQALKNGARSRFHSGTDTHIPQSVLCVTMSEIRFSLDFGGCGCECIYNSLLPPSQLLYWPKPWTAAVYSLTWPCNSTSTEYIRGDNLGISSARQVSVYHCTRTGRDTIRTAASSHKIVSK